MAKFSFGKFKVNDWHDHWKDMPEYDNEDQPPPEIIATFKFRNREDFEEFNRLLKQHVYKENKVFDGMQRKDDYQAWFPLQDKASRFAYVDEDES